MKTKITAFFLGLLSVAGVVLAQTGGALWQVKLQPATNAPAVDFDLAKAKEPASTFTSFSDGAQAWLYIRRVPVATNVFPGYAPNNTTIETTHEPIVKKRADGIWEIKFK